MVSLVLRDDVLASVVASDRSGDAPLLGVVGQSSGFDASNEAARIDAS